MVRSGMILTAAAKAFAHRCIRERLKQCQVLEDHPDAELPRPSRIGNYDRLALPSDLPIVRPDCAVNDLHGSVLPDDQIRSINWLVEGVSKVSCLQIRRARWQQV